MSRGSIRVEGLEELKELLGDITPAEARRITRRVTYGIAGEMRDAMRARVPVRTGNLKRSIKVLRPKGRKDFQAAEVRADRSGGRSGRGNHWHLVEYGTVKMKAQPFAQPVITEYRGRMQQLSDVRIKKELEREIARRAKRVKK